MTWVATKVASMAAMSELLWVAMTAAPTADQWVEYLAGRMVAQRAARSAEKSADLKVEKLAAERAAQMVAQ